VLVVVVVAVAFRQIRRFLDSVSQIVFGHPFQVNRPIEIFLFNSQDEYHRFAPESFGGHARRTDAENQIALGIEGASEGTEGLYHELVHTVLHNDPQRRFPSWFHEGLAVFLGTSVLRGDVLTIGGLPSIGVSWIQHTRPLSLRTLLASPIFAQRNVPLFYADAWAFVHFGLLSASLGGPDRHKAFGEFVLRVSRGEPWEPAFVSSFQATPEEIAEEYERHREKLAGIRVMTLLNVTLESDDAPLVFEPVDRLEMARRLTTLADGGFEVGLESDAQLYDLLLAADPKDPEAICGRIRVAASRGELELAGELWERLPEDQREGAGAWLAEADLALARAEGHPHDDPSSDGAAELRRAMAAYQRALAVAPDRFAALAGLGQTLVLAAYEDPAPGIAALTHAVELYPELPETRLDLAELLIRSHAPDAAIPHLDYVIEAFPSTPYSGRAQWLRLLAR